MDKLITDYKCELAEAGCLPGSGRYGLRVMLTCDISPVLPYLNAVLDNTRYDHENRILVGEDNGRRCAFRSLEIRIAGIEDVADVPGIAKEVTERVNQVWREHDRISPCFSEQKMPAVIDIYRLLPRTNCRQCGYLTCLVFAAELRENPELMAECRPLSQPEYSRDRERLEGLFSSGEVTRQSV